MKNHLFIGLSFCLVSIFSSTNLAAYTQDAKLPDQFQYSLSGLKESMAKLEEGNASFNLQIMALKQEQERLRSFLKDLEQQEETLREKSESFEASAEQKRKLLEDLQNQIDSISAQIEQVDQDLSAKQSRWSELQDQELKPMIEEAKQEVVVSDSDSAQDSFAQLRQEKLKLMKEVLETQKRQQMLQEDLIHLKKIAQKPATGGITSLKEKNESLKQELAGLQGQLKEIDALEAAPQEVPVEEDAGHAQKLAKIQEEVANLKQRKEELSSQIQSSPVEQKKAPADDEMAFNDRKKLEDHLLKQRKENRLLQQQAKELKAEMVSLDKKKAKIESKFKRR